MASFKILLVVALVAFIGSSGKKWNIYLFNIYFPKNNIFVIFLDALECMYGPELSRDCAAGELSCKIEAKISKYILTYLCTFMKENFFSFLSSDISDHMTIA